jgi:gamma-glutamyltranspeptidase/glutathione hydrolase
VSDTYAIESDYGIGVVVSGAGFLLNNEMDDFSAKPGVANIFGVMGNKANEIQLGNPMLSPMSPTLLFKNGEIEMVLGTPGGSTFLNCISGIMTILDYKMTPQDAMDAERFHHQLVPADLVTYSGFTIGRHLSKETVHALLKRGYRAAPHSFEYGDVQIIVKNDRP